MSSHFTPIVMMRKTTGGLTLNIFKGWQGQKVFTNFLNPLLQKSCWPEMFFWHSRSSRFYILYRKPALAKVWQNSQWKDCDAFVYSYICRLVSATSPNNRHNCKCFLVDFSRFLGIILTVLVCTIPLAHSTKFSLRIFPSL